MSFETRYAAAARARADRAASTPEAAEGRRLLRVALERARADVQAKFPVLPAPSAEDYGACLDYQQERIAHHRRELGA